LIAASLCSAAGAIGNAAGFDLTAKDLCNYDAMAAELKLSQDQVIRINTLLSDLDKALAKWDSANAPELASLRATQVEARKAGEIARLCEAMNRIMALANRRRIHAGPYLELIRNALTDEQRATWEGYRLGKKLTDRFRSLGLSADQRMQIRTLCNGRGAEMVAMRSQENRRGVARIEGEVNSQIIESVLAEHQRNRVIARKPVRTFTPTPAGVDLPKPERKPDRAPQAEKNKPKSSNRSDDYQKKELEARKRREAEARRRREADERRRRERNRNYNNHISRRNYERLKAAYAKRQAEARKKAEALARAKAKAAAEAKKRASQPKKIQGPSLTRGGSSGKRSTSSKPKIQGPSLTRGRSSKSSSRR